MERRDGIPQATFPLPLSPFEEYMVKDDRPAYPMLFFVRLRFQGRIEREVFEQALRTAIDRHPLLSARIQRVGRNRHQWVLMRDTSLPITWSAPVNASGYPLTGRVDLYMGIGLHVFVIDNGDNQDLVLRIHHACADGKGIFRFAEDLLVAYANPEGISHPESVLRPANSSLLPRRAHYGLDSRSWWRVLPKQIFGLRGTQRFFVRHPSPLTTHLPHAQDSELPDEFPAVATATLEAAEQAALRGMARQFRATTNDLLVRDLFLALGAFRRQYDTPRGSDWLRLSIPVNLRNPSDGHMTAANIVSMVFLDCRMRDLQRPGRLLRRISAEMGRIKKYELGLTFVLIARLLHALPGAFDLMARTRRCLGTGVFSNLGRVLDETQLPRDGHQLLVGNLRLYQAEFAPPFRPLSCASFSATQLIGRLHLALHYDPRILTAVQGQQLLQLYLDQLRHSMQECHPFPAVQPQHRSIIRKDVTV
jgi:NRPS condensation-like uncharacterized protein